MDILAEKVGVDPFEIRYRNVYRPGCTNITGQEPEVFSLPELMDKARPHYYGEKKRVAELNKAGGKKKYGVGIAIAVYGCGLDGKDSSAAWVELQKNGNVLVGTSWEDHGQGADIGSLTMAHQTLCQMGIQPEQICLLMNDTAYTPASGPAGGSRSNVVTGNAIRVAAENLVAACKKPDGTFMTYDELVAAKKPVRYEGSWIADMCEDCSMETAQGKPFSNYMYEVFVPTVSVDTETGKATVEAMYTSVDVGVITNKSVVDGQIYGGIAQGIGLALTEDFEDLKKHDTLVGCGIPEIDDIPDSFQIEYVEAYRPSGPYGSSGVGEVPLSASAPAVLNAVYDACGVRITEVPALPEKILAGLKAKK
jgi:aldehyde oxidoreductase